MAFVEMTNDELSSLDEGGQTEYLKSWFLNNFEDPANETPYDSEDGYVYIWGGPFEPFDVLTDNFDEVVKKSALAKAIAYLKHEQWQWAPKSGSPYFEDPEDPPEDPWSDFKNGIAEVDNALTYSFSGQGRSEFINRLLFANVISAIEVYLQQTFMQCIDWDSALLRKFVENYAPFTKIKIPMSKLFEHHETMKQLALRKLSDEIIWHKVGLVKSLSRSVLGINIGHDFDVIAKAIDIRHDIVHRNGKGKDGCIHQIAKSDVAELSINAVNFVDYFNSNLPTLSDDDIDF